MPPDTIPQPLLVGLGLVVVMNAIAGVQLLQTGETGVLPGVVVADLAVVATALAVDAGVLDGDDSH